MSTKMDRRVRGLKLMAETDPLTEMRGLDCNDVTPMRYLPGVQPITWPAPGMTVNHEYQHRIQIEAKSDGYSPGPPIPPRREVMPAVIEWGIAILAALVIVFLIASFVYTFQHLAHFYAG